MLGGLPFCARSFDDTKEGSSTAVAESEQQTATDKDAIRLRKEEVTVWMVSVPTISPLADEWVHEVGEDGVLFFPFIESFHIRGAVLKWIKKTSFLSV
ncbi:unnamed protein product [Anisakis simplex]|uniref:Uncharacterized protein n=1 Tax=Anisakis simplex TaxID=6269 RepID=A0A0M3JER9_ANISI|nr:unnamed protein product [Anisakis simplex]